MEQCGRAFSYGVVDHSKAAILFWLWAYELGSCKLQGSDGIRLQTWKWLDGEFGTGLKRRQADVRQLYLARNKRFRLRRRGWCCTIERTLPESVGEVVQDGQLRRCRSQHSHRIMTYAVADHRPFWPPSRGCSWMLSMAMSTRKVATITVTSSSSMCRRVARAD